jgi:hypothetical protein
MRTLVASLLSLFALSLAASGQTCTGLCLQQVSCPAGTTTSITGTVFAPNGTDPLPNVLVFIPNAPVDAFTPGVSCPVVGQPPSGAPLVGATTAVDGTFKLLNVPVGTNIPLVIQTGRWRRQVTVSTTAACVDTPFSTRMPRNQTEGDIPKIAVATGSADAVECVLRKVGLDDSEFTNPSGTGRINIYLGSGAPGARVDASSPSENVLMGDISTLNSYDVLMLPCEGGQFTKPAAQLANLIQFANSGGRVYSSHFSYVWMFHNPPFSGVVNWNVQQSNPPDGIATVDTTFSDGKTLADWLQIVGATTTVGQMPISTLRRDFNNVVAPTQSWLRLNNAAYGNPVQQFVFNAPVGASTNQCGRVLFNEYHVENPSSSPTNKPFPTECSAGNMTAQEKLLEYSLFELTSDGSAATLTPTSQDFGSQPIGFATAPQNFTWTNNSTFSAGVSVLLASGDFVVTSSNCASVLPGQSCNIGVAFKPTNIGARTGVLTVGSSGSTLTATLTGKGIPDLVFSFNTLEFGNLDVGNSATKSLAVTNNASGPVNVPPLVTTGDYSVASSCGNTVAPLATCNINVTFKPTTTGSRSGTLTVNSSDPAYSGTPTALTGNGVDFTIATNPSSGSVIAGYDKSTNVITTPLAGFVAPITISCSVTAPGSTCALSATTFGSTVAVSTAVNITTTSQYAVIGYGGLGGGSLWIIGFGSGCLLWIRRRSISGTARAGILLLLVAVASLSITGCSGKLPAQNSIYTKPGTYTYTITATDGFLVHSATYSLTVTAK